jgi:DHA2 family multidrug resistance protein
MMAANDIFWGSALLFLVMVPLVWLTHPQRAGGGADAAAGAH